MTDDTEAPIEESKDPLLFKLKNEIDETDWSNLEAHYDRGALVFISPDLELIEVASKIIKDEVDDIKIWTENKQIYNPKEDGIDVDKSLKYRFIITQPFVLIQPIVTNDKPKEES